MASSRLTATDKKIFETLLYIDEIRGPHSTGVCAVNTAGVPVTYKRALRAADFMQLRGFNNVLAHGDKLLMGHNRYATLGAKDDNNAHPFTHGDVTLVHNGTLTNKSTILDVDDRITFPTDSETVAYALSLYNWKDVVQCLEGAYALVWYDKSDNTLNFARNDERPLYLGTINGDLVWASEKAMLELAAEHDKSILQEVQQLPVGKLWCYDMAKLSDGPAEEEFTPKKPISRTFSRQNMRRGSNNSVVNTKIKGYISEIRDSGYCAGYTLIGQRFIVSVPKNLISKAEEMKDTGGMLVGTVASTHTQWDKGKSVSVCNLSSLGVEFMDKDEVRKMYAASKEADAEKKCGICQRPIINKELAEYHYGGYFHTRCLDDQGYGNI